MRWRRSAAFLRSAVAPYRPRSSKFSAIAAIAPNFRHLTRLLPPSTGRSETAFCRERVGRARRGHGTPWRTVWNRRGVGRYGEARPTLSNGNTARMSSCGDARRLICTNGQCTREAPARMAESQAPAPARAQPILPGMPWDLDHADAVMCAVPRRFPSPLQPCDRRSGQVDAASVRLARVVALPD
jgi:hypothetical protein